mgnify:CR=1 FL=1
MYPSTRPDYPLRHIEMKISKLEKLEQMFRDFKEIIGFYRITSVAVVVVLLAVTSLLKGL